MKRYAILAYEQLFGGLHGMNIREVIEASSLNEADNYGYQASLNVITSYEDIIQELEEEVGEYWNEEENPEEFDEALQDRIEEDLEWTIWEINEAVASQYDTRTLETMFYDDPDIFIEKYCLEL